MKIFRYIWNFLFGKSKGQEKYKKGGIIEEENKEFFKKGGIVEQEEKEDFFASTDIIEKEKKMDSEFLNLPTKKRNKNVVGQKTLNEIKEYLIANGSLDVITCEQKFKVKSLHNFIWHLRKDGFEIKTDKISLQNEIGVKVEVSNYRLITKK
jgi:hypothetical protein